MQYKQQDRSPSTFDTRYNRDIRSYVRHGDWLPSDAKRLGSGGPSGSQGGSRMRLAAGKATEEGGKLSWQAYYDRRTASAGSTKEEDCYYAVQHVRTGRDLAYRYGGTVGNARTRDIPVTGAPAASLSNSNRSARDSTKIGGWLSSDRAAAVLAVD